MKKTLIAAAVLSLILLTTGMASAHGRWGVGFFFGPPVISVPGPIYPYSYYRPYPYYGYDYGYYPDRVWIPGHWEQRRGPYGWGRFWVPGHWRYRY